MQRRTVILGMAAAVALPAFAQPAPQWRSMSKGRFGPTRPYGRANTVIRLPVREDVPSFDTLALKLTGGPLWLDRVTYRYAGLPPEDHAILVDVGRNEIIGVPPPSARLVAVDIIGASYSDGHRYWHLIGANVA